MIVEGQVHGGVAQGLGQALLEQCVYDAESGQLLTGSYMDYAMPRADDMPSFKVGTKVTPCTHNPLGAKGCGEAGAIGSPAAMMNAVHDALLGVRRHAHRHAGVAASRVAGHPVGAQPERRPTHVQLRTEEGRLGRQRRGAARANRTASRSPAGRASWPR